MDRYVTSKVLGQGTYGVVYLATEKETGKKVAIKKIRRGNTKEGVNMTALREIKLLRELPPHDNIVTLLDVVSKGSNLNLVFEYMQTDLEDIIKEKEIIFSTADIKSYMLQMLRGLEVLHQSWIIHRDVKPNNMLLSEEGVLKLGDFGLARIYGSPRHGKWTTQVCTRWYRAPELLMGKNAYGPEIDVWALGCIFAELMLRTPFLPGESDIDQLHTIYKALGTPDQSNWPEAEQLPAFMPFESIKPTPLRMLFSAAPKEALDLLEKMLTLCPERRITCSEALEHPYFTSSPPPTHPGALPMISGIQKE